MSVDKLFNIVSGVEYQLNILKDTLKDLDKEEQKKVDEAYQKGYKDCETRYCSFDACPNRQAEYQRGLDDAWEAARKIFGYEIDGGIPIDKIGSVFGYSENATFCTADIIRHNTASEAIDKLKAYEEKQNDEIEVGDEVLWFMKGDDEGCDDIMDVCAPSVVTMVPNKECDDYTIIESSGAMTVISKEQIYKKTGRHFDIASILEDMRND